MKYSIKRSDKSGRYISATKAEGTGLKVAHKEGRVSKVSKETLKSAKAAANLSYREISSKR